MKKIVFYFLGTLIGLTACEKGEVESFNANEKNENESITMYEKSIYQDPIFIMAEEMPEFPGGKEALDEFLVNSLTYPEAAKTNGIEGKVYISFVVEKDGSIGDVKIVKGVDTSLGLEALRVVKNLPNFKPGKQRGETVRVSYTIPITFALN